MSATRIEWCDRTVNPVVGCSKCSPGCDNCYAERFSARMARHSNPKIRGKYAGVVDEHGKWTGKISALDLSCFDRLPKKPARIFVGSMCDLFHDDLDMETLERVFWEFSKCPQHTFLLLTKRPERMRWWFTDGLDLGVMFQ